MQVEKGNVVCSIWRLLDRQWSCCISHVFREGSVVADSLAHMGTENSNALCFLREAPVTIRALLLDESVIIANE